MNPSSARHHNRLLASRLKYLIARQPASLTGSLLSYAPSLLTMIRRFPFRVINVPLFGLIHRRHSDYCLVLVATRQCLRIQLSLPSSDRVFPDDTPWPDRAICTGTPSFLLSDPTAQHGLYIHKLEPPLLDKRQPSSPFFSSFADIPAPTSSPAINSIAMDSFASFDLTSGYLSNSRSEEVETPTEFESDGGGDKTLVPNCVIA